MWGGLPSYLLSASVLLAPYGSALRLTSGRAVANETSLPWTGDAERRPAKPRVTWNATEPIALLNLQPQGHPHHHSHGKKHTWLFGAHHKSGTILLHRLALILGRVLEQPVCSVAGLQGPCGSFGSSCWQAAGARLWFDCRLSGASLERARSAAGGALRAVHIVRDPMGLVLSGYVYHMRGGDGPHTAVLRRSSLADGLALEAQTALEGPLREMLTAYQEGAKGGDALVVRLEEFTNSSTAFDAAVERVYRYAVGDLVDERTFKGLVKSAAAEDLLRHPTSDHSTSFSHPELKRQAALAFESLPEDILKRISDYRKALGYA
mmetsp:Transcript_17423/g.49693  ORF Transcript_17423/g.49693 Transcript_17423/m.49693 type:complete len:321 (+) Transcript_17423:128-1090(+)